MTSSPDLDEHEPEQDLDDGAAAPDGQDLDVAPTTGGGGGGRFIRFCRRHKILTGAFLVLLPFVCLVAFSWSKAMTKEGQESFLAKNVQWARDNNLGFAVDRFEQKYYEDNQPESGGTPDAITVNPADVAKTTVTAAPGKSTTTVALPKHITPPVAMKSPAATPIEHEGEWIPAGPDMGGGLHPMYTTKIRPNAEKTSLLVFVAWMDPNLAKVEMVPGTELPGGKWSTPPRIPADQCSAAIAAMNSGFRMDQARGGFYGEGRQQVPLRNGAASMMFYKDGRVDIGQWGREVGPNDLGNVNYVRQNLELMVDNGQPVPDIDSKDWGALLPNSYFIWRSAFGVTKDGAVVYVGGPAMQPRDLAQRMIDAGVVRGMEMDINPEWVTANLYSQGADGQCHGVRGLEGSQDKGGMRASPDRYLSTDTRDFVAVYSKPQ